MSEIFAQFFIVSQRSERCRRCLFAESLWRILLQKNRVSKCVSCELSWSCRCCYESPLHWLVHVESTWRERAEYMQQLCLRRGRLGVVQPLCMGIVSESIPKKLRRVSTTAEKSPTGKLADQLRDRSALSDDFLLTQSWRDLCVCFVSWDSFEKSAPKFCKATWASQKNIIQWVRCAMITRWSMSALSFEIACWFASSKFRNFFRRLQCCCAVNSHKFGDRKGISSYHGSDLQVAAKYDYCSSGRLIMVFAIFVISPECAEVSLTKFFVQKMHSASETMQHTDWMPSVRKKLRNHAISACEGEVATELPLSQWLCMLVKWDLTSAIRATFTEQSWVQLEEKEQNMMQRLCVHRNLFGFAASVHWGRLCLKKFPKETKGVHDRKEIAKISQTRQKWVLFNGLHRSNGSLLWKQQTWKRDSWDHLSAVDKKDQLLWKMATFQNQRFSFKIRDFCSEMVATLSVVTVVCDFCDVSLSFVVAPLNEIQSASCLSFSDLTDCTPIVDDWFEIACWFASNLRNLFRRFQCWIPFGSSSKTCGFLLLCFSLPFLALTSGQEYIRVCAALQVKVLRAPKTWIQLTICSCVENLTWNKYACEGECQVFSFWVILCELKFQHSDSQWLFESVSQEEDRFACLRMEIFAVTYLDLCDWQLLSTSVALAILVMSVEWDLTFGNRWEWQLSLHNHDEEMCPSRLLLLTAYFVPWDSFDLRACVWPTHHSWKERLPQKFCNATWRGASQRRMQFNECDGSVFCCCSWASWS